jgi:hypothetical protein
VRKDSREWRELYIYGISRGGSQTITTTKVLIFCSEIPPGSPLLLVSVLYTTLKHPPLTVFEMDAIVQAILNLSKLEVTLIKIEDATPE